MTLRFLASRLAGVFAATLLVALGSCSGPDVESRAAKLAKNTIILDGHIDVPYRLSRRPADVSERTEDGDFDYYRAREGGLDAPFMSIYVPASYEGTGNAREFADELIDSMRALADDSPEKFAMAGTADEVRRAFDEGKIALLMGMENGSPIEGDLANLDHFYERGVRYITLCHSKDNHICESSYDEREEAVGLLPFGYEVVRRMNELGMLIDVSHVSDAAFWDIIETTRSPVIASHSSLRHFIPDFERNMSDRMVERLAQNGGVIQINFGSTFVTDRANKSGSERRAAITAFMEENGLERRDPAVEEFVEGYDGANPFPRATVADVADHIDRVVRLAGVDYVGLGSDFDGVGDTLPDGLRDVSMYPQLIAELLRRGYSDSDIEKICSGNVLRVMEANEHYARTFAGS